MRYTRWAMTDFFHVINIKKPLKVTSHDVVYEVRRVFGLKKVGHMGTLDPMADGVLPVALGKATRLLEYFPDTKRYQVEITFGKETTTLDQEGGITSLQSCPQLTEALVSEQLEQFKGTIEQEIPLFSAKKVNGKKLYELARENVPIDAPVKTVTIHDIQLIDWQAEDPNHPKAIVDVYCGTGTFMRAIARDLGKALGCGAYMSALTRTAHGQFELADAVDLDTLKAASDPQQFLKSPVDYLNLPRLAIGAEETSKLKDGMKIPLNDRVPDGLKRLHDKELVLFLEEDSAAVVAVCKAQPQTNQFKPVKVFN